MSRGRKLRSKEPVTIQINTLAEDGCGYSADGTQAVFGALAGEVVLAEPIARKRKRTYLRALEVTHPSPDRVEPGCPAALFCGGCTLQHIGREGQLRLKENMVRRFLDDCQPETWQQPLVSDAFHYRSKARLGVKFVDKKDKVLVGFREKQKPYIAEIDHCPVLRTSVSNLLQPLADLIGSLTIRRMIPQIEVAVGDDKVALIIRHMEPLDADDGEKLTAFAEMHNILLYLQPGGPDSVHRHNLQDESVLTYNVPEFDLEFEFGPLDFTQVNFDINRKMIGRAIELLDCQPGDQVIDGFCGIGNFSLALARRVAHVTGLEYSPESIAQAKRNAMKNGLKNVDFMVRDLYHEPAELPEAKIGVKVLIDPPRSGAQALVKVLASSSIERVVYVSCNPETLARDIKILAQGGFNLRSTGIIDMFPHTTHVESIALLIR